MNYLDAICPKCGSPSKDGDLCEKCRMGEKPWITYDSRVEITRCPCCGAIHDLTGWNDTDRTRDDLENEAIGTAIHIRPEVRQINVSYKLNQYSNNRTAVPVKVEAVLFGQPVSEEFKLEIIWINDACNRCNRQNGNYWEGIVQIRAEGRKASIEENNRAQKIAIDLENEAQLNGDRLSFITKMEETREGLDIIIGAQSLGELIAREVTRRMGGRFTMHPTLVGEKNGQKLFRITYSVRLPKYQRGDVIFIRGTYGEILGADSHVFTYLDLSNGIARTVPDLTSAIHVGHIRNAVTVVVVYQDRDTLGIMDPDTGVTEEVNVLSWKETPVGEEIRILRDHEKIIVV